MKISKKILFPVIIVLFFYLLTSLYISFKIYSVVKTSYESAGVNNPYACISDELFCEICCNDIKDADEESFYEYKLHMPMTFHWFIGARTILRYDFEEYGTSGDLKAGSRDIDFMISSELKNGRWIITDYLNPDPISLSEYLKIS